jgi:hypothetical protein
MRLISDWLYRYSNWPALLLITLLYAYFIAFVMAPQATSMQLLIGDWGAPDGHLFYTPDTLYTQLLGWSIAGQQHYINFRVGLDPIWAFIYSTFLVVSIGIALRYATAWDDKRRTLNLFPLIPMLADLSENLLGITLVYTLPQRIDWLAWLTALTTGTKWLTLAAAHLIMLYAVGLAAIVWLRSHKHDGSP